MSHVILDCHVSYGPVAAREHKDMQFECVTKGMGIPQWQEIQR